MYLKTDSKNIAKNLVFNFHSDSGHGWLAVKNHLIRELDIIKKISKCSYTKNKTSYLEEDSDASIFIKAFKEKFGFSPKIKELKPRNNSPIRNFPTFYLEE